MIIMVFSSLTFIILFLPFFLIVYWLVPKSLCNLWILICSLGFYYFGAKNYVYLLLGVIFFCYIAALLLEKMRNRTIKKVILALSIGLLVLMLCYFKYFNSILLDLGKIFHKNFDFFVDFVQPIGISFFVFQAISYISDVYMGETAIKNPVDMGVYISCFPQLIAGPIVRYQDIAKSIKCKDRLRSFSQLSDGCYRFCIGLIKKVVMANNLGGLSSIIFDGEINSYSVMYSWLGALAYTLQIYYDFSGYTDMAIGLGKMIGFEYRENFNYPYISRSITEFWKRWHISLSLWFRDYVYIPLGGNRNGKIKEIRNLFIVWGLTGFWHGASWNYIVWGVGYCVLLLAEKLLIRPERLTAGLAWLYRLFTMAAIILLWVVFRANDISDVMVYLGNMFAVTNNCFLDNAFLFQLKNYWFLLLLGILFASPAEKILFNGIAEKKLIGRTVTCGVILSLTILSFLGILMGSYNPFLYFMF